MQGYSLFFASKCYVNIGFEKSCKVSIPLSKRHQYTEVTRGIELKIVHLEAENARVIIIIHRIKCSELRQQATKEGSSPLPLGKGRGSAEGGSRNTQLRGLHFICTLFFILGHELQYSSLCPHKWAQNYSSESGKNAHHQHSGHFIIQISIK